MKELIRTQQSNENENDFVFSLDDKTAAAQLKWEGDDEFSLNGEMYDVIEKKVENNKLIIRCFSDKKETTLLQKAKEGWKENERSNKIANELLQLLQTLFHNSRSEELTFIKPSRDDFYFLLMKLPLQVKRIPTPPPQPGVS